MFAIKITGRITGAEFILDARYPTQDEADRVVARIKASLPSSETIREVVPA